MAKLRAAWRSVQILHVALASSVAIYAALVAAVTSKPQHKGNAFTTDPQLMLAIFGAIAVVMLVVVIPLVRVKMMPKRERVGDGNTLDLDTEVDPTVKAVLRKLQPPLVVTWALCEAVATFGLALAFLYWDLRYYLPFGGVALAAMLVFAPRLSLLEECVRAARQT